MSSRPCVYCREREAEDRYRPFCSARCQLADLGRWLRGDYRVATESEDDSHTAETELDDAPDGTGQ